MRVGMSGPGREGRGDLGAPWSLARARTERARLDGLFQLRTDQVWCYPRLQAFEGLTAQRCSECPSLGSDAFTGQASAKGAQFWI